MSDNRIALQIKSLEQSTIFVTLPRNASVLDLKQEIQLVINVDSNRQRLIFQGRVLKDDKHLTDYANLDDGKVVHLVIRPSDAPHNPLNDEPNTFQRSRPFPSLSNQFPLMEGYAFITLGSSPFGGSPSFLSLDRNQQQSTTRSFGRTSFVDGIPSRISAASNPHELEGRLIQSLSLISNIRSMLGNSNEVINHNVLPTAEQILEVHRRLRNSGNSQTLQIGMVMQDLADLMSETVPSLRQASNHLRQQTHRSNEITNIAHVIQGMSFIHNFLGSVLSSVSADANRRQNTSRTSHRPTSSFTLPPYFFANQNTDTPSSTAINTTSNKRSERSPLSTSSTLNESSSSSSSSNTNKSKRKMDDEKSDNKNKKLKKDKGKDKLD